MRLAVPGAGGRMGRMLVRAIAESGGKAVLSGAIEREGSPYIGQDAGVLAGIGPLGVLITADAEAALGASEGLLDFTTPAATLSFAQIAAQKQLVHIIGTTGCSPEENAQIAAFASKTVLVKSGNMSLGVNVLAAVARKVASILDEKFDIEIIEMHHNRKVDAPSGTALLLGQAVADGRQINLAQRSVRVRDGYTGPREEGSIGFATLRGGTVVGDHTVMFAGPHERIELSHKAEDRSLFASGALTAALWGRGKAPGLYSMADVLGLNDF
jgi:4-hydroxy-tetrahydrodipicolinate reductase